jgi:hypothetical protein
MNLDTSLLALAIFLVQIQSISRSMAADTTPGPKPFHQFALTPPMGWNSWDCFGTTVTEQQTKATADYMADKLLKHGYQYVVVDIQWYEPNAKGHDYKAGAKLTMDANGRLLPADNKFPSAGNGKGFKPLADYIHGKGLKFGIHLMRGIPRQAVDQNLPVLGSDVHAADIANRNSTCAWNQDMFGVDMTKPGAQAYYDSVFKQIADWGVDFVKVDDLSRPYAEHQGEIEGIRKAIDKTGRAIVLSMSPGETPLDHAEHAVNHANMWRISDDFWDNWKSLDEQFARCANWAKYTGPGHWPDADMLPVGAINVDKHGWTHFTHDEQYTLLTLWSMARSPLMIGGNLPDNDAFTLALLTNDDVLAIDQHSVNGHQLWRAEGKVVWIADDPISGAKYVALFNTQNKPKGSAETGIDIEVPLADCGLGDSATARDLWKQHDLGAIEKTIKANVPWHGAVLLRVTAG